MKTSNLSFDCGVDTELAGMTPLSEEQVIKEIERRKAEMNWFGRIVQEETRLVYLQDDATFLTGSKEVL
jgi:hypothetical protein